MTGNYSVDMSLLLLQVIIRNYTQRVMYYLLVIIHNYRSDLSVTLLQVIIIQIRPSYVLLLVQVIM